MHYDQFRFEAVVDIIEARIHTTKRNQGWRIKRALALHGISYVKPVQPDAAGWSSYFTVRLYDPRTFTALQSKLAIIEENFPFQSPPTITMIEVAFDGYLKDSVASTNQNHLVALAARMAFRHAKPVSSNRRIFRDAKGISAAMPRSLQVLEHKMADGWNVGIGNKTDDQYQHCYLKTTDKKKPIPTEDHRARFEIRLTGAGLPHTDVESYREFRFETLAKYICFRKEDESATPLQRAIIAGYGDQASHRKNIKRKDGGGFTTAIMPSDDQLNRIVRKRLQTLTKRW